MKKPMMKKAIQNEAVIESRPKVLALYQGVLELLDEGADLSALKVSDITDRAGIGKGTAYEYFKRKEDIIAGAVVYDMERHSRAIRQQWEGIPDFNAKVRYTFDWILNGMDEQKAFSRFMYFTSHVDGIGKAVLKCLNSRKIEDISIVLMFRELCARGRDEGQIRNDLGADEAALMLIGDIVTLVMAMEHMRNEKKGPHPDGASLVSIDLEKMKNVLCEGYLSMVSP